MVKCDVSWCDNEGDHKITKLLNFCGTHWFVLMNGLKLMDHDEEMQRLRAIEIGREG